MGFGLILDNDQPFCLLIRHAERDPIKAGDTGEEALLTKKGHFDSVMAGKDLLSFAPFTVLSSPVERCRETACGISAGLQQISVAETKDWLGSGYVLDWKSLMEQLPPEGFEKILIDYLSAGSHPGFKDITDGSRDLLAKLEEESGSGNLIAITHDAVIMPLLRYSCPDWYKEGRWLSYLSGALITFSPLSITPINWE